MERVEADESWAQGRAVFGGLVAEAAVRARAEGVGRPLRSFVATLMAPVAPGAFEVEAATLRAGGSVVVRGAEVWQDGARCAVMQAAFGAARPTLLRVEGARAPSVRRPDGLAVFPFIEGVTPAFTRHFEYRWTVSSLPFSGASDARVQGWVRARGDRPVDEASLVALIDAWPPPVLSRATGPAFTWHVDVVSRLPEGGASPRAWWLWDAAVTASDEGYADFEGHLWDEHGTLVAVSRELSVEFSGR